MKKNSFLPIVVLILTILLSVLLCLSIFSLFKKPVSDDVTFPDDGKIENNTGSDITQTVKREPRKISFLAAGDSIIHSSVYEDAKLLAKGTGETYNFCPMFDNVKDIISSADIAFVNQETPCAGEKYAASGYPMFNTPDEIADALIYAGFDIVNISNNHMLDKGTAGLERCVEFWNGIDDICLVGCYDKSLDCDNIKYFVKDTVKIAFLSYTYGTNGLKMSDSSDVEFYYCDKNDVDRQTKLARKTADIVIVSMHWGVEDRFTPTDEQKEYADILTKNNVDVVIGTHPHVIETIEWKQNTDGHKTLVAYSLGNMLSTMLYSRNMLGGFLTFDILENENEPGTYYVDNAGFIPTVTHYSTSRRALKIYKLSDYTPELEKVHGSHANEKNKNIDYLYSLVRNYIPKEFISEDSLDFIYE